MASVSDTQVEELQGLGYSGSLADMQYAYLRDTTEGEGSLSDLKALGSIPQGPLLPEVTPAVTYPYSYLDFTEGTNGDTIAPTEENWTVGLSSGTGVYADAEVGLPGKSADLATAFRVDFNETQTGDVVMGGFFKLDAFTAHTYVGVMGVLPSTLIDWRIHFSTRIVHIRNNLLSVGNSGSVALALGQTYHYQWKLSGTTQTLRIYELDDLETPYIELSGAAANFDPAYMATGIVASSAGSELTLTFPFISDDWYDISEVMS